MLRKYNGNTSKDNKGPLDARLAFCNDDPMVSTARHGIFGENVDSVILAGRQRMWLATELGVFAIHKVNQLMR